MSRARIFKDELIERNTRFLAIYIETKNSCLMLLSEKEDRLGTLVAAIPPGKGLIGPSTSSVLLGSRNSTLARILAEKMASKTGKVALVSIYLETIDESSAGPILVRLIEKIQSKQTETEVEEAKAETEKAQEAET